MIISSLLLGAGAVVMGQTASAGAAVVGQAGAELAKSLVAELAGGSIEHGVDALLHRISPQRNQDFMRAVAAAMRKATGDMLELKEDWRQVFWTDSDRAIWQDLGKNADKLFIEEFDEPQKSVRNALLIGTVDAVSEALEGVVVSFFDKCKARTPEELKLLFPPIFLHAFEQVMKDEAHKKGWKAFQRELSWALHQRLIALNQGNANVLECLKAMYAGRIELPDITQEFDKQAQKMIATIRSAIREDGEQTRSEIAETSKLTREMLDEIRSLLLTTSEITFSPLQEECDPEEFYKGNSPTNAEIAAGLDVPRTQYTTNWSDKEGKLQSAWKSVMLQEEQTCLAKRKLQVVIIYGHRGSGKTTLCRRMIHDLRANSSPVVDLLDETLKPTHVNQILAAVEKKPGQCFHIFTEVNNINEMAVLQPLAQAIGQLKKAEMPSCVYIAIDTNKWGQIENRIKPVLSSLRNYKRWHLNGQLDDTELEGLIARLKLHHCLFRLEGKPDDIVHKVFRRKAQKGLLTCLIEATRGTHEGQTLSEILREEFEGLGQRAQWAYGLVTLFGAFGIRVPASIMEKAFAHLSDDPLYFGLPAFLKETKEIVYSTDGTWHSRNQLVAKTLLDEFTDEEHDAFKYRLFDATLHALNLANKIHQKFYESLLERKVIQVMKNPSLLVDKVRAKEVKAIQGQAISYFLNSVVRIYQGHRQYHHYEIAKELAEESLKHWDHIGNLAHYLRACCCYSLGEKEDVIETANQLIENPLGYESCILHGIDLLCKVGEWEAANNALEAFFHTTHGEARTYPSYHQLFDDVERHLRVNWSEADLDALPPSKALERIEFQSDFGIADPNEIANLYQRLLRRAHDYSFGYISFFGYVRRHQDEEDVNDIIQRQNIVSEECTHHLSRYERQEANYPRDVLSILHANLARALHQIDYIFDKDYPNQTTCEDHFGQAIHLKQDNWYAHNWYGSFLRSVRQDRQGAFKHYEIAMRGDKRNPVFKYNVARLLYWDPIFSRPNLERSRELAREAQSICKADEKKWEYFNYYPDELLENISLLLARQDLKDGDPLDTDTVVSINAD